MAKTATRSKQKAPKKASKAAAAGKKRKNAATVKAAPVAKSGANANGAADAIVGLLESPLVADILATGAAAALASITHHRLTRRREASSRQALKEAVKSAAAAMGARLSEEFEEILESAKKANAEAK